MYYRLNETIIALNKLNSFGKRKTRRLLENLNVTDGTDFFSAINRGIQLGVFQKSQPIGNFLEAAEYAKKVIKVCEEEGIKIINAFDPNFPEALKFENHPLIFFYKGNLDCLNSNKLATVVGTRHPNQLGIDYVSDVSKELAKNDYIVVSGLAAGCDTIAHQAVLEEEKLTVAFLPSSLNRINPSSNLQLAQEIIDKGGLVITEFSPLAVSNSGMFIERDKLLAGVAKVIFVSEFDDRSGTLQTLDFGAKFRRPIYTLESLIHEPEFNGYDSLIDRNINIVPLNWVETKELIEKGNFSEE